MPDTSQCSTSALDSSQCDPRRQAPWVTRLDSGLVSNRRVDPSAVSGGQMLSELNQPSASFVLPAGERGVLALLEEPQRELQLAPGREGRELPALGAGREICHLGVPAEQGIPQGLKVVPVAEFT